VRRADPPHGGHRHEAGPFTDVWEFDVTAGADAEFRHRYGPNGTWAQLFRHDPSYVETWLLHDPAVPGRYLTVDHWRCIDAYRSFRERFATAYAAIDRACEALTRRATHLGAFHAHGPEFISGSGTTSLRHRTRAPGRGLLPRPTPDALAPAEPRS
jgi:hypothetical protein